MSEKETRKPPFGLNMPFDEALERFAGTDRDEALAIEKAESHEEEGEAPKMLTWKKKLSTTDAQQPTKGALVPYLRLTSGSLPKDDFQTWFRGEFFDGAAWMPGVFHGKPVEEAYIPFQVTVHGLNLGAQTMLVTHDETRQDNNNAPNTWIHWNDQMENLLKNNDCSGEELTLTKDDNGVYRMDI